MDNAIISSSAGIIAVLAAITSLFFYLENKTRWKLFSYLPPLIFIYVIPVVLSNSGLIPSKAPLYDFMGDNILPMFLVIMLLEVDILATVRVMGKGIFVMLLGTVGGCHRRAHRPVYRQTRAGAGYMERVRGAGRKLDWRNGEYGRRGQSV